MEHDSAILELCQRGHPAGFTRLVTTYRERVFHTAFAFVHNREDALDVTQEVFIRTVRAIDSLAADRPLWPWLRKVTANLSLNLLRSRRPHLSLDSLPDGHLPAQPDQAAETAEASWTSEQLHEAMGELPPAWRMALVLRHQEGLSYDEVAQATGLPLGTVKTYIFRARRMLRERLTLQEVMAK